MNNNIIDMSLDDIIRLNKKKSKDKKPQNKNGGSQANLNVNKFRHFRGPTNPVIVAKFSSKKNNKNKPARNFNQQIQFNNKNKAEKIKQKYAIAQILQAKRLQLRQQELQLRRQEARLLNQNQSRGLNNMAAVVKNRKPRYKNNKNLVMPQGFRGNNVRNLTSTESVAGSERDVLTISINNNNVVKRGQFWRDNSTTKFPFRNQGSFNSISDRLSKARGIKGLKPYVNHTTKTLNDRFTNHNNKNTDVRVVFT